mmetsp:Transcript_8032/g.11675  ORF Transcript_8032/g.11675 Transcript_8032/m.11675 type:complete len:189 (+) Transcript_8032:124-690(+)
MYVVFVFCAYGWDCAPRGAVGGDDFLQLALFSGFLIENKPLLCSFMIACLMVYLTMVSLTVPLLLASFSTKSASAFSFPSNNVGVSSLVNRNRLNNIPQHVKVSSYSKLRMAADDDRPLAKPILDKVNTPSDLKGMNMRDLKQLAHELRWEVIENVSKTGGHFSSSLGVVELTVALHHVFDAPEDDII